MKSNQSPSAIASAFLLTLTCCSAETGVADAPPAPGGGVEDVHMETVVPSELSEGRPAYLALGDSVAFGEDGFIPWTDPSRDRAVGFVGYPELLSFDPAFDGVANLACPGETTGSFLSATAADNGCREYRSLHPHGLHTNYPGETQGEAALAFLAESPDTRLITLNLGGNDLLLVLAGCASAPDLAACAAAALPGAITQAATNLASILGAIRGSGYAGKIVYLTQYSTNYNDPLQSAALPAFNDALAGVASQFGVTIADGYAAFQRASHGSDGDPCAAGLLIPSPSHDGTCDKHPSRRGQALLALTTLRESHE
jgi:lysophospholipase L1-like esterase